MQHHHDWIVGLIGLTIAAILGSISFWIAVVEDYGWFMTRFVIPTLAALVAAGQLYFLWRKYRTRG